MAVTDDRLVELWSARKTQGDEHRDYYEDRWINNWALYRNTLRTRRYKLQSWNSNVMLPDAFRIIETSLPQHVMGMYRNPNWFSVEAPTAPGETYQQMVKALLLQGWRRADGFRKTVLGMKNCAILGHLCPKTTWKTEIGELVILDTDIQYNAAGEPMGQQYVERTVPHVTHNGPDIQFPDLFNLWQDPTGSGMWWIERIPKSFMELEVTNQKFNGNLYKNLKKLKQEVQKPIARDSQSHAQQRTGDQPLSVTVDGIPEQFAEDSVELWQCWGYIPPSVKRYDDTQWRMIVIANYSIVIRDEPAPTHNHMPPYDNVPHVPIPGQVYGDSVLSYAEDLIKVRSEIENMRVDEVLLNIFGTYWVDGRAQIRGQQMIREPGGAMRLTPYDPNMSPGQMFGLIPRSPVLQEAYLESNVKEQQLDQTAGTFKTFQGQAFGGRTSASEVGNIMNVGTSRFQFHTMWMDESFKLPVLKRMFALYQSKMSDPQMVALLGQPQINGDINFSDLQYDVDIYVDSGLYGSLDQQQANSITQVYGMMMQNPQTAPYINIGRFLRALNYRMGLAGTSDDFVRSEDEVRQIMAQQLAAQQAAGATGNGSGAPANPAGAGSPTG